MSDLWQSRPNCTYAKCTVSTYSNSWCLKNLRVESGIIKQQVKLHHHCICLHICLLFWASKTASAATYLNQAPSQPAQCVPRCIGSQRLSLVRSQMCILLAHILHLRPLGHSCSAPIPAFDPPPLSMECRISLYSFLVHLSENIAMMTVTSGEMLNKHSQRNFKEV